MPKKHLAALASDIGVVTRVTGTTNFENYFPHYVQRQSTERFVEEYDDTQFRETSIGLPFGEHHLAKSINFL